MEFLRREGRRIVDEQGREVLLKGYGIGSWMNVEGFLFGSSHFSAGFGGFARAEGMNGGRSINQILIETCGRTYAESFWKRYYENYFAEADIRYMAELGFNSLRLPLNARVFLKEEPGICWDEWAFALLEKLVCCCEENGLYVILDLHAAAAGQSAIGCDDGVDNQPHLFTDEEGWERSIVLWEELARRYKDRAAVAGYELLNEPLALESGDVYLPELRRFYDETIRRIRAIDRRHILFLQGHRFASRWDIFEKDMDPGYDNWVLTMHLYEAMPDLGAIGGFLRASKEWDVPVWMGETNGSHGYMATLYEMLYENHVGVNIWCHKGVAGADAACLCQFDVPAGMEKILRYGQEGGPKPSYEESMRIMDAYLEGIRFENCTLHADFADAVLRRGDFEVPAVGYDMLPGRGISWKGSDPYCIFCGYRREDDMQIVYEPDFRPFNAPAFAFAAAGRPPKYGDFPHLELLLEAGDFACYTVRDVEKAEEVKILYRAREEAELSVSSGDAKTVLTLSSGMGELREITCLTVPSGQERAVVKIECTKGRVQLKSVRFAAKA